MLKCSSKKLISHDSHLRFLLDAKSSYEDPSIAIRRAVVEALAMRASGSQDITEFEGLGEKSDKAQITVAQDAQSVSLSIMRDDGKKLSYEAIPISSGALVDMENASQTSNLGSSSDKDPESDMQKGQSWADVPLRDPSFKFTVRSSQDISSSMKHYETDTV